MMKRLEAVFKANVILYIESFETIVKLIQVNKSCQEATKMIKYCNKRKFYESDYRNYGIVNNIFDIFPKIETIRCEQQDILNNLELFGKVNQIELIVFYTIEKMLLPKKIKNKIIRLDINRCSLVDIRLKEFPNVRKVKFEYSFIEFDKKFLGDKDIKLNQLIIETDDNEELDCLKEYKNIKNKIIIIRNEITKERYHQLNKFANVYCQNPIAGIEIKDSFHFFSDFKISNKYDIKRLYDLTLFTKCALESDCDCDLKNCELLEEIETAHPYQNQVSVQIEGLKHLKRIKNITKVDCIPSSVTKLSFNSSFNYNELLEKNSHCFANIKEIEWGNLMETKILMNFKNCTKIELISHNDPIFDKEQTFEIPQNVIDLVITREVSKNQMKGIEKITGLKKLEIYFEEGVNKKEIQDMFGKLKKLEWLKTDYVDEISLPSTLTCLEFQVTNNIDLIQYTNLKELNMINTYYRSKEVKIPNKLNKIYVNGNLKVINSNEIEVKRIFLDDTTSQFCKWKSKNIFIVKIRSIPDVNES